MNGLVKTLLWQLWFAIGISCILSGLLLSASLGIYAYDLTNEKFSTYAILDVAFLVVGSVALATSYRKPNLLKPYENKETERA